MKEKLKNKRHIIVAVITSVIIFSVVFSALTLSKRPNKGKAETKPGVSDTAGSEKDAGEVTEEDTGKTAENNTENTTESTTAEKVAEKVTEKTTQKPVNTTTTTKKPVNNKPETTTKYVVDQETLDFERTMLYRQYGGEEGYKAELQKIANAKCLGCGNHNCPSMVYHKNRLGDVDGYHLDISKCPQYGNIKCSHCGKILVETPSERDKNPDKYCLGNCYYSFG